VGDANGVSAFVYGKRTVLAFPSRPLWLTVRDENGVAVPYEREGRYYRLSRKLERFTVWADTRVLVVSLASRQVSAVIAEALVPVPSATLPVAQRATALLPTSPVMLSAEPKLEDAAVAVVRLSAAQQDEVRRVIDAEADSAAEARILHARLDRVETQLHRRASAMILVRFDTAATSFAADGQLVRALVPAAKAAQRINLRGRTDARIAGRNDARIAFGRALAARQFLIEQGIDGSKIKVFALSAGDFLAPTKSEAGRALNRRVEIELVDHRYAELRQQVGQVQGTAP
jgi:outer membrane protein OmpA-like peptidoglycan-associated protein